MTVRGQVISSGINFDKRLIEHWKRTGELLPEVHFYTKSHEVFEELLDAIPRTMPDLREALVRMM